MTNHDKHGIDFEAAQAIWSDEERLEIPAKTVGESRYLVIGKIKRDILVSSDHVSQREHSHHLGATVT